MTDKIICTIYRSERKAGAYLYTTMQQGLEPVPAGLLGQLGELVEVMAITLEPGRKLANADIETVMVALKEQGFYLQMPPGYSATVEASLAAIAASAAQNQTNSHD